MIRTVSLWIRVSGKFSQPLYQDIDADVALFAIHKQTRLRPQDGEYYLRCAGKWFPVGNDPLLALDAKAAKEKLLRAVERGTVPESEALPHLNPPTEEIRLTVESAINTYMTIDKLAERLAARHLRHPGNGLVFPNSQGNPEDPGQMFRAAEIIWAVLTSRSSDRRLACACPPCHGRQLQ